MDPEPARARGAAPPDSFPARHESTATRRGASSGAAFRPAGLAGIAGVPASRFRHGCAEPRSFTSRSRSGGFVLRRNRRRARNRNCKRRQATSRPAPDRRRCCLAGWPLVHRHRGRRWSGSPLLRARNDKAARRRLVVPRANRLNRTVKGGRALHDMAVAAHEQPPSHRAARHRQRARHRARSGRGRLPRARAPRAPVPRRPRGAAPQTSSASPPIRAGRWSGPARPGADEAGTGQQRRHPSCPVAYRCSALNSGTTAGTTSGYSVVAPHQAVVLYWLSAYRPVLRMRTSLVFHRFPPCPRARFITCCAE